MSGDKQAQKQRQQQKREQQDALPGGLPITPHWMRLGITPENDAKLTAYTNLVATEAYQMAKADINVDLDWWTRVDDLSDRGAISGYKLAVDHFPVPQEAMHWYLAGLMKGLEQGITLPSRWMAKYAAEKKAAELAVKKTLPVARPRAEGMRIDPTPPRRGEHEEPGDE